ncbi:MAG TPA: hypothetical protein VFW09_04700 [Solirubrobacteraceae bacterium]|nr:hypothetical protein [Solirubrobacteraceae bacterium]
MQLEKKRFDAPEQVRPMADKGQGWFESSPIRGRTDGPATQSS